MQEPQLEKYDIGVLEKYRNAPEQYTIENDNVIKENNRAWMIKYNINPRASNRISVHCGDVPNEEREHWNQYRVGVPKILHVNRR